MTEFTAEWIKQWRFLNTPIKDTFCISALIFSEALDEIERLQARVQELEQERAGILVTLDEVVKEAYLQEPFSDDAGMNLLHGASLLLKKMLPQPPEEGE